MSHGRVAVTCGSLLWVCLWAAAPADAESSDHLDRDHRLVRIDAGSLHPEVLRVGREDAVGWLNYSWQIATVSFDASVLKRSRCRERDSFHRVGHRVESRDLRSRGFAALCSLGPGDYEYRVRLHPAAGGDGWLSERELVGRLVVE